MPHRILQVLTPALHPNAGGVQMTTWKLSNYFAQCGHAAAVYSFSSSGHAGNPPAKLFHAPETGGAAHGPNLEALAASVREFKPDIVINQMPYEAEVTDVLVGGNQYLLLGCLRNTLFSVRLNLDNYIETAMPRPLRALARTAAGRLFLQSWHRRRHGNDLRQILKKYDYFVMFGPPNINELRYFVPDFDQSKVELIPNSIPAVAAKVPEKSKKILWLGRIDSSQKRAGLIFDLWRRVHLDLADWEFDVVGEGPALHDLKAEVERAGLPRIRFHGRQRPDDYYKSAAIFVMTSAFEGFPNTLIEAQSYGAVPIIFDSYPIASWIVKDNSNGFLVRPFDVDGMADRIVALARADNLAEYAEACLVSAARFEINTVGRRWEEFFNRALKVDRGVRGRVAGQALTKKDR